MPPRKTRSDKSSAPSPSPALSGSSRTSRSSRSKDVHSEETVVEEEAGKGEGETDDVVAEETAEEAPVKETKATKGKGKGKAKGKGKVVEEVEVETLEEAEEVEVPAEAESDVAEVVEESIDQEDTPVEEAEDVVEKVDKGKGKSTVSMEERLAKMKDLRIRMNQSTAQNRKDLVADHQKQKVTARDLARLEKQKKLAHTLRLKVEAEESGQDMERVKNWEYSIEQNERWEQKQDHIKEVGDSSFHNAEDDAHKLYNRNIKSTKPDIEAYNRQKQAAVNGYDSTVSVASGSKSRGLTAVEDLYRGADTLAYGDHRPDDDAVDRVIGKINKDMDKKTKKKRDDTEDEVTYINQRNKVFNKKIARYFDKYTKEIRANFERGTAL